jgi:hypothetical protein
MDSSNSIPQIGDLIEKKEKTQGSNGKKNCDDTGKIINILESQNSRGHISYLYEIEWDNPFVPNTLISEKKFWVIKTFEEENLENEISINQKRKWNDTNYDKEEIDDTEVQQLRQCPIMSADELLVDGSQKSVKFDMSSQLEDSSHFEGSSTQGIGSINESNQGRSSISTIFTPVNDHNIDDNNNSLKNSNKFYQKGMGSDVWNYFKLELKVKNDSATIIFNAD